MHLPGPKGPHLAVHPDLLGPHRAAREGWDAGPKRTVGGLGGARSWIGGVRSWLWGRNAWCDALEAPMTLSVSADAESLHHVRLEQLACTALLLLTRALLPWAALSGCSAMRGSRKMNRSARPATMVHGKQRTAALHPFAFAAAQHRPGSAPSLPRTPPSSSTYCVGKWPYAKNQCGRPS